MPLDHQSHLKGLALGKSARRMAMSSESSHWRLGSNRASRLWTRAIIDGLNADRFISERGPSLKQELKVLAHVIGHLGFQSRALAHAHSVQRKVGTPVVGMICEIALPIGSAYARKT